MYGDCYKDSSGDVFFLLKGSGNKEFPEYDPQTEFTSVEENRLSLCSAKNRSVYPSVSHDEIPFHRKASAPYLGNCS